MPEYLAPGVFVEETSFRSKSIEGVATTTTGMIGPCAYGPVDLPSELLTSLADFERTYGGGNQLELGTSRYHNYLWHAVRAFFTEGGKRLYVVRTYRASDSAEYGQEPIDQDGIGYATATVGAAAPSQLTVRARQPGAEGAIRVRFTIHATTNILAYDGTSPVFPSLRNNDVVLIFTETEDPTVAPGFYRAIYDDVAHTWSFAPQSGGTVASQSGLTEAENYTVKIVTVSVASVATPDVVIAEDLALVPGHVGGSGTLDSLLDVLSYDPMNPARNSDKPIVVTLTSATANWTNILGALGLTGTALPTLTPVPLNPPPSAVADGHARGLLVGPDGTANRLVFLSRYPGKYGNFALTFTVNISQNVMGSDNGQPTYGALQDRDIVLVIDRDPLLPARTFCQARRDPTTGAWQFIDLSETTYPASWIGLKEVRIISVGISVAERKGGAPIGTWSGLALDPDHQRGGVYDSLLKRFMLDTNEPTKNRELPIAVSWTVDDPTDMDVLRGLLLAESHLAELLSPNDKLAVPWSIDTVLSGGFDGVRPTAGDYEGKERAHTKTGLKQMEDLEDVSILAAPGSTLGLVNGYGDAAKTIVNLLIAHAQKTRAIAVLDSGDRQSISDVRGFRGGLDSSYAALYYPWVMVLDPITQVPIALPPSGFVAGIYARNDTNRAVYKAPANEVVNLALGFEQAINVGQQQVLNPEGINCFRYFEGRGNRLWGARTASSDPEWKYVNIRRYFLYLERSIDRGTQWAVFEPNGEKLWANVRRTIEDFLLNEWQSGALLGDKPEKAFFVRCDRSTMTQNDLDNGRLICLIGVAALKPAEFVIFRIGQWTADRKG